MGSRLARILVVALAVSAAVFAAGVAMFAQDKPKPAAAPQKDIVLIDAKVSRIPLDSGGPATYRTVKFTHKDTVVVSELVTYEQKTKTARSPGKISISDPECDITGDKGTADFGKKLGQIEGNVVMLLKPKTAAATPDNQDSLRTKVTKPTTVLCPKIEYQYRAKIATLTGPVTFKQEKREASANKAVWDGKTEILTLTGSVKGVDEDGQTFAATTVRVCLKNGDEWMEAENATASVKVDLSDEGGDSSQAGSPPTQPKP